MEETLLKEFAELKSKDKVQEFYKKTLSILTSVLDKMQNGKNTLCLSYEDTRIFPMGDYTNDTFIDQTGELEIVIASCSSQLKLNNNTYLKNLKNAKTKKEKALISSKGTFDELIFKFLDNLASYYESSTTLLVLNQGIKILCLEEYGFKILIRFATYDREDKNAVLNFWDPIRKKETPLNLFVYNEKIDKKDKETKGNYKKLVRIFKNIRKTILVNKWATSGDINKYFVELIVFNIPSSIMMDKNIKLVVLKALNYLENCNVLNFKSFDGLPIETFNLAKVNYMKIKNYIAYLIKVLY